MTTVVNVKVAHIRPRYKDLSDWMKDPNNFYIGRAGVVFIDGKRFPTPSAVSAFHNPFKVGAHGTRENVIEKFETYIRGKLSENPELVNELLSMRGKSLGCWCKPEACHGDVLVRLIEEYASKPA